MPKKHWPKKLKQLFLIETDLCITEESKHWQKEPEKEAWFFKPRLKNGIYRNRNTNFEGPPKEFEETVVQINRISKKTKGGNQIRFSALVVVGDRKGKVGVGLAKATDVRNAIRKSVEAAKRKMIVVPLAGTTIPYSVNEKFSAAKILLKPAPPGSGIIAGGPMRVVLEAAGVRDAVGKILGTKNKISNVYATLKALETISEIVECKKKMTRLPKIVAKSKKRVGTWNGKRKRKPHLRPWSKRTKKQRHINVLFEGMKMKKSLLKRLPLMRGKGKFHVNVKPIAIKYSRLEVLPVGSVVTVELLVKHGILKARLAKIHGVKIIGIGDNKKKFTFKVSISKRSVVKTPEKASK